MNQNTNTIRVKIKGYDHKVVDNTVKQIIDDVKKTGANVKGPVCIPSKQKVFTVLNGPHIDARSKGHFSITTHIRVIDIIDVTQKTIENLTKLTVPSGVSIEIK